MAALLADQLRAVAAFPYGGSSGRRRRGRGLQGAPAPNMGPGQNQYRKCNQIRAHHRDAPSLEKVNQVHDISEQLCAEENGCRGGAATVARTMP